MKWFLHNVIIASLEQGMMITKYDGFMKVMENHVKGNGWTMQTMCCTVLLTSASKQDNVEVVLV